jgi:excisionase family DNA binding protein
VTPHTDCHISEGTGNSVNSDGVRVVLTIEEAARRLGIGRTTMYALVMSGEVRSVTIGRLRRVPAQCLDEYVAHLLERAGTTSDRPAA